MLTVLVVAALGARAEARGPAVAAASQFAPVEKGGSGAGSR